jgi:hypothetical protein
MEEIVTVVQAERTIALLAVSLPVVGLLVGAVVGAVRRRLGRGLLLGLICGLSGPALWALWRMYNGITGVYGLDSVRGLLVNLALFVAIGLVIGLVVGLAWRRLGGGVGETASSRE